MKKLAVIACICTALAAPLLAAQRTIDADACLDDAPQIETITQTMTSDGWSVADLAALDDRTIEHIAWMRMRLYLGGDQGGESVENLLNIQRKTARGMYRKLDLETSKTRVLTRLTDDVQETALVLWLQPKPGVRAVTCQFTQIHPHDDDMGERIALELPSQSAQEDGATLTVSVTRYNTAKLPTEISAIAVTRREVR